MIDCYLVVRDGCIVIVFIAIFIKSVSPSHVF